MVELVTRENSHLYEDILIDMHRMRYRVAVEEWGWNIPGIEFGFDKDKFDTEDTIYFIALDSSQTRTLACARLNPTLKPHMLEEAFARRCISKSAPRESSVYELSRYIVDHQAMSRLEQKAVRGQIVSAVNLFCIQSGITHVTFLSYMSSYARTIKYWQTRPLGLPAYFEEDDATYIAAISAMTQAGLRNLQAGFNMGETEPHISSRVDWERFPAAVRVRAAADKRLTAA